MTFAKWESRCLASLSKFGDPAISQIDAPIFAEVQKYKALVRRTEQDLRDAHRADPSLRAPRDPALAYLAQKEGDLDKTVTRPC